MDLWPSDVLFAAQGVEEKLAFPRHQAQLDELAQRKCRILTIQNGSRRNADASKAARLHEGSLRALWKERAQKNAEAKQVSTDLAQSRHDEDMTTAFWADLVSKEPLPGCVIAVVKQVPKASCSHGLYSPCGFTSR